MLERLNFYDIYGYFLPGAALVLLLWLPFGLVRHKWPASDLGSAVIGVVVAYISGLVLQMFATKVIPSSAGRGSDGHARNPSDIVLDRGDSTFSASFKTSLAKLIKEKFDLDLGVDKTESREIDKVRRDAFLLARQVLIGNIGSKEASYVEQFEGMYTLTRGLTASLGLAFVYYAGWGLSVLSTGWSERAAVVAITIALLVAVNLAAQLLRTDLGGDTHSKLERIAAFFLLVVGAGIGYGLGRRYGVTAVQAGMLGLCAIVALLGCLRFYGAYKFFATTFAITVWRDFFVSAGKGQAPTDNLAM